MDSRSLNSTLADFIFHGQILKLFRFNSEGIYSLVKTVLIFTLAQD